MKNNTKKLTATAMFCALAFVAVVLCRIPVILFLSYEPKDIVITLGGLIYGPWTAFLISVIVSVVEMITISRVTRRMLYSFRNFLNFVRPDTA